MHRRRLVAFIGIGAAAWPMAARAQISSGTARIGFLSTGSRDAAVATGLFDSFRQGLIERGHVEGRTVAFELRTADGRVERFREVASEMVQRGVAVIVATNSLAAIAARQATASIPIVVPVMGDPIGDGLADSLARPGGNVTGLTFLGPQLLSKRLALLKEMLPQAGRIASIWHPAAYGARTMADMEREAEITSRALGLRLRAVAVRHADDLEPAFATIATEPTDALFIFPSPMLFTERTRIVALATRHKLPSMAMAREFAALGGLMAYGASLSDLHRRAATYVDKILKGAKPGELPIEQPTKFELVINGRTAKSFGIPIPPTLMVSADDVIE